MSLSTSDADQRNVDWRTALNVPNQLTGIRLLLAMVLFGLIAYDQFLTGMYVFIVAAGTDWIDGYWARKYNQVTTLGRILDPFVDKIIICGTFIFLAAIPRSGLTAAMAVVVVGRELMVTALRSFLEQQGADFSATLSGKLKMVLQCVAAAISLFWLHELYSDPQAAPPEWLYVALKISVWSAVALTVISGIAYIFAAIRLLRG